MTKAPEFRRENLRKYVAGNGGPGAVAQRLGYANGSFLVQMIGPNPTRNVSERTARDFEEKLGLAEGCLDEPVYVPAFAAKAPRRGASMSPESVIDLIHQIGRELEEGHIEIPIPKFADLVALALENPSPEHIRLLVRLAK